MAKYTTSLAQFGLSSRHASYRLGLIDPSTLASLTVDPLDAPCFKLLVPGPCDLPTSLLIDPEFQDGAIVGYDDLSNEMQSTPAGVVNWVWKQFSEGVFDRYEPLPRAWVVGFILGALSYLADVDRVLSLVGIAHLSYILALVPSLPLPRPLSALREMDCLHDKAVRAYRLEVRTHKEHGMDFQSASRAALAGFLSACIPSAGEWLSDISESEVA